MNGLRFPWVLAFGGLPAVALTPQMAEAQVLQGFVVEEPAPDSTVRAQALPPVAGGEVWLLAQGELTEAWALTDSLGHFAIVAPGPGTYGLRVSHPAYLTYEAQGIKVGPEETVNVEIRLGRNVIPLEPLVVTARIPSRLAAFHQRRSGAALGVFITRGEIEARAPGKTTDLLRGVPGVNVRFERWGVGARLEMRNGFGTCEPAVFVDGIRIPQSQGNRLDDFLTPERIEGVEVYASLSTAPAQYVSGICGVILFWTRRGEREEGTPWRWKRVLLGLAVAVGLIAWIY